VAGAFNLAVSALRWGEDIHATVQARFPGGGHRAEVTDIYPGGAVVYRDDPGEAQIFVRITRSGQDCAGTEWEAMRAIPHCRFHQDLAVIAEFEGRTFIARTRIHRFKPAKTMPDPAFVDPALIRRNIGLPPGANVEIRPLGRQPQAGNPAPVRQPNRPLSNAAPPAG